MEKKTWLVVGLGNPGEEYENTPHNLGFHVVDLLAARHSIRVTRPECRALVGRGSIEGSTVVLAKPQTYMNLSGGSVKALLAANELGPESLLVVYDELALPWQTLRIRPRGSSAGHHGIDSVIGSLGTDDFARVRLGVHPGQPGKQGADYLLAPMRRAQKKELEELLEQACRAVESIIAEGVEKSMTKFNRRAGGTKTEEG